MKITIQKKVIAAVVAAAVLVTGVSASQAQAGDRDTERALAAILGLAVIGAIIADSRDDDDHRTQPVTRRKPAVIEPRPLPRRVHKRALPEQCLRVIRTDRGNARFFGRRCMESNYPQVNRLPRNCERRIRTDRGTRYGWGARCLRQNGFQIAGY